MNMLPRFESQTTEMETTEKIRLLPRFQSHDDQRKFYDENQSADTTGSFAARFTERTYDRSGKKCWAMINTKMGKFDLEHTYDVVKDALESYIHYRKLDRCKALSNFIEYRNKVYKREKMTKPDIPKKVIQIEQETPSLPPSTVSDADSSTLISSSKSLISEKSQTLSTPIPSVQSLIPPKPIPPSRSMSPNTSQKISPASTKESIIPIPSPGLLKRPISKSSKVSIPKKKISSHIKQPSSLSVKDLSSSKTKQKSDTIS